MENCELNHLVKSALEIGVTKALVAVGQIPEMISAKEAYDLYGASNVKRWTKAGLVERNKAKGATQYSRIKLGILSRSFA